MMDALEFLKERRRLCSCYEKCIGCPLKGVKCSIGNFVTDEHYSKIIATVEQWSKEHPYKTRQSVFLEQYPETEIDKYGCLRLCPELVSADYRNRHRDCINRLCIDCRREFWMQEVEE